MERLAKCQCGSLRAHTSGEPILVNICHCDQCKRRTGAAASCNAYFAKDQVRIEGEFKVFSRDAAEGRKMHNHFCPECGTTVCWLLDFRPDCYGVAVGTFADPTFPAPTRSVWEAKMLPWTALPAPLERFSQMPGR